MPPNWSAWPAPKKRRALERLRARSAGRTAPPFVDFARSTLPFALHDWQERFLCPLIQEFADSRGLRVLIHAPPQYGKSILLSQRGPAWLLGMDPLHRIGLACYNETHAAGFGAVVRDLMLGPDYAALFPDPASRVKKDAAAGEFFTAARRGRGDGQPSFLAMGLRSGFTGRGLDTLLLDDPYKSADEARSELVNESVFRFWRDTASVRIGEDANVGVMFHRYWEDDLAGRLRAMGGWRYVRLPAIADANLDGSDPTGRAPGELLSPMRSRQWLDEQQRNAPSTFAAQFQGDPVADGGNIFRTAWFAGRYRDLPPLVEVWTCWDTALKAKEQNDETACVTAGRGADGNLYLLRVAHGRWETPDVGEFLVEQAKWLKGLYGDRYRGDYVEDKVSGTTLIQYLRRSHPGVPVIPVPVEIDKVARAHGATPLCESGRVILPDLSIYPQARGWVEALLAQLASFPNGRFDDVVDAFVYALKKMLGTLGGKKSKRSKRGGYV